MARKAKTNELLLPSLALSALALTLVGVLVTSMSATQTRTNTSVSANKATRELTSGYEIEDLEADLKILEEDSLQTELNIIEE